MLKRNVLSHTFVEFSACAVGGGILAWWIVGTPALLLVAAVAVPLVLVSYNSMTKGR